MVAAIVGIRKLMDFFPQYFSQRELSWLDDVIPEYMKKGSGQKKNYKSARISLQSEVEEQ